VNWLLFIVYLVLFSWLITKLRFTRNSGLPKKILVALFVVKVLAGIIYFQFHSLPAYKDRSDTWKFYNSSLIETRQLKSDPVKFVAGFFQSGYKENGDLFSDKNSYWNDVKDTSVIKLMAVINLFTWNNYYANIVFFNFLFFIGLIAFYRLMKSIYSEKHYELVTTIFLIPSFLFWCSGIHKDGLIFSAIGLLLFCFHRLLNRIRINHSIIIIVICLLLIFLLRNYLAMLLLPSMIIGFLVNLYPKRYVLILFVSILAGTVFVFTAKHIHPSLNIPQYFVEKQTQFKNLEGSSIVATKSLEPDFASFIAALPTAVDMGFFRPHPGESGIMSILASVEIIFFWLIFVGCIIYRKRLFVQPPIVWTILIFAFLVLLIIGYTVPFSGAVVRYRSLILPLILGPMIGIASKK
jgi:hypothetical protein